MSRIIEIFTAGCPLCESPLALAKQVSCPGCHVIVHDLADGCETAECVAKARGYGVKTLPAVVVDGQLADCCTGGPEPAVLAASLRFVDSP